VTFGLVGVELTFGLDVGAGAGGEVVLGVDVGADERGGAGFRVVGSGTGV
jgi:hypothetical protein